jgi:hypothetical protein
MPKAPLNFRVPLTPTQRRFVESDAPIVFLIGPEGEGKTYSGLCAILRMAQRRKSQGLPPLRAAILRDTFENILTKTIPSLQHAIATIAECNGFPAFVSAFRFSRGGKRMIGPHLDCDLFGANDLADLTRLQGGEWSVIWIEEPAPMYAGNNAGIPKAVFDAAISRAARGGGEMRVQVTSNPADEDHWTYSAAITRPIMRPEHAPDLWTETIRIPYGDNPARTDRMRQATKAAYSKDPALWARLVEGRFAFAQIGEKVCPEYNERLHRATSPLPIFPRAKSFRFYDGGLTPTCIIGQITPSGQMFIKRTFRGVNIGMRQLLERDVVPFINSTKFKDCTDWDDIGDSALNQRGQADSTHTASGVIYGVFGNALVDGAISWEARREAMKHALTRMPDGEPFVQIDPSDEILHKSLRGGWHYAQDSSGNIIRAKPVKDIHSHPGDAFAYGCSVYSPGVREQSTEEREALEAPAFSYAGGIW